MSLIIRAESAVSRLQSQRASISSFRDLISSHHSRLRTPGTHLLTVQVKQRVGKGSHRPLSYYYQSVDCPHTQPVQSDTHKLRMPVVHLIFPFH